MSFKTVLMFAAILILTASKNELFGAQSAFEGKAIRIVVGFRPVEASIPIPEPSPVTWGNIFPAIHPWSWRT